MNRANWRLTGLILITLLAILSSSIAQVDTWTQKADMPTPTKLLSAVVVNGVIYVIGGFGDDKTLLKTLRRFETFARVKSLELVSALIVGRFSKIDAL